MKLSKFSFLIFFSLLTVPVLGCLQVFGAPSLAKSPSEVPVLLTIPDLSHWPNLSQMPGMPQMPRMPSSQSIPSIFTPQRLEPREPFDSIDSERPELSEPSDSIDLRVVIDINRLRQQGDQFLAQGQHQQAAASYDAASQEAARMNLGQNQCASKTTVVRTKPISISTMTGNSSQSQSGNSSSASTSIAGNWTMAGGSMSTHTIERSGLSESGRTKALTSLYELGLAYFKLAQVSGPSTWLNQSNVLITRVAQELGVFSHNQTTTPGQQQSTVSSTGNSTTFQVSISSERTQSHSSACLTNTNYTLEANTFRLLEQIYLAQGKTDEALKVSEAGRTIEVDKNIAYNLFKSGNEKLTEIAKDLSHGLTLDDIKQLSIDEKATIVSYSTDSALAPTKVSIWVIRNGQIRYASADLNKIRLDSLNLSYLPANDPDRGKMQALLRSTRTTLAKSVSVTPAERQALEEQQTLQLMALYRLLIAPIEKWLPDNLNEHLVFVPHGALFFVPFAALQDPKTGQYLIDKHTIRTAPNLRSLSLSRQQRPIQNGKVVVVGNPKTSGDNLQGAEKEANVIEQLFQAKKRDVAKFLNEDATKEHVKRQMENSEIIHLAAHGILDTGSGNISISFPSESDLSVRAGIGRTFNNENTLKLVAGAIALTPSGQDDGLLTASEILSMNLNANLVVLSACDTGRGPLTAGGVIGLPLSFSLAKVPNIMVSLWAVPDTPTSQLMVAFYEQLLNDPNADKAKALREAMRTVKQMDNGKYKDPINWAAFTLIGTSR